MCSTPCGTPAGADKRPGARLFSRSTDGGATWSPKSDVSTGAGWRQPCLSSHGGRGTTHMRISLDRHTRRCAVEHVLPQFQRRRQYLVSRSGTWPPPRLAIPTSSREGFVFPFGDYYELAIDRQGVSRPTRSGVEGKNYEGPGQSGTPGGDKKSCPPSPTLGACHVPPTIHHLTTERLFYMIELARKLHR